MSRRRALPKYLSRDGAARFVSQNFFTISKQTLAGYAVYGTGPRFYKIGHQRVLYAEDDLVAWATAVMGRPIRRAREARPAGSVTAE